MSPDPALARRPAYVQARLPNGVPSVPGNARQSPFGESGRGFARLPKPDPGDLFFDMEGDPLHPQGLEYLFGLCLLKGGSNILRLVRKLARNLAKCK